jgi:hypothetical protein
MRAAGNFGPEGMQTAGRVVGHLGETDGAGTAILDPDGTDDDDLALMTASATRAPDMLLRQATSVSSTSTSPVNGLRFGATLLLRSLAQISQRICTSRERADVAVASAEMPLEWVAIR